MKIGIMTRWNMFSGQSSHAEPIAHAWLEMGHELKVFAPKGLDMALLYRPDEPFVHRCFVQDVWGQRENKDYFFDAEPYLDKDYDIFLMEMAYLMPMPELLGIFPQIRRKAKTVLVVHETGLPPDPNWYKFEWDAIVCFDERYKAFMSQAYPEEKIEIIPYPCHPPLHGDKGQARMSLGLPLDTKLVFAYGFNILHNHVELFPVTERLSQDYPVLLFLLTHHDWTKIEPKPKYLRVGDEMPSNAKLYAYLHACDAYVNYVGGAEYKIQGVGVSSSVAACLGAGRPVLVPSYCNFFDLSGKEVIKYGNAQELELRLRDVFENAEYVMQSVVAAEEYATRNSGSEIARQFMQLFKKVLDKSLHPARASFPRVP